MYYNLNPLFIREGDAFYQILQFKSTFYREGVPSTRGTTHDGCFFIVSSEGDAFHQTKNTQKKRSLQKNIWKQKLW